MKTLFFRLKNAILLLGVFTLVGVGCNAASVAPPESSKKLTLTYWSVEEDFDAIEGIVAAYRTIHPNVRIEYKKFRIEEYEDELLDALAEDRGPDILSVHNTWMRSYQSKLLPMPSQLRLAFRELQGALQKKAVWVEKIVPGMTPGQVKNQFVSQVSKDAIMLASSDNPQAGLVEQTYGLPLSVDTLALYFNRDVLNSAGIPTPAQNWTEFQDHVKRGTRYDEQGKLVRPFAGIGTTDNVDRNFDILSLLMMQNGAEMTDSNGFPTFNKMPRSITDREVAPGIEALIFYTDFGNPAKEVFTWDDTQPNSFDAFVQGKTGYFLGYAYHMDRIRAQAPKLNFGVKTIPQIHQNAQVNYANYWLEGVSRKTAHPNEAWDFVRFMTSGDNVKSYLDFTGRPTAVSALVNTQLTDDDLAPFAAQTLTAQSWYQGRNIKATEDAFDDLIEAVLAGADPRKAINLTAETVSQTFR